MFDADSRSAAHQLAAIVEWSDDAIVSKDLNGIITSWNKAAELMFGYTASETVGRSIRMIVPADRQAEEDEVLRRIRCGDVVNHFETWRRRKDGTLLPISLTISPIRNEHGEITGASKIARDITDRHLAQRAVGAAERAHRELQQRLQALVSASQTLLQSPSAADVAPAAIGVARQVMPSDACALWRVDPHAGAWRIVMSAGLSDAFEPLTSRDWRPLATRVVGDVGSASFPSPDVAALRAEGIASLMAVPLSIRSENTGLLVFYYRTTRRFSEVDVQTAEAIGTLVSTALTTADLYDVQQASERRSAFLVQVGAAVAAAPTAREVLAEVVARAVPDLAQWCAAYLVGESGAPERVALARTDAMGERPGAGAPPAEREAQAGPGLTQVLRTRLPLFLADAADAQPDGLSPVQSYMCVPLMARGHTLGAVSFARSGSVPPFTRADLLLAQDLASAAALAVDNAQVSEALRRADRLKDEFLATLSHELRTPLNAILGYAGMLRSGRIEPDRRDHAIEVLERNASALSQIVEDVLDVSRIVSGKLRLEIQPIDLTRVLLHGVETVQATADAKGVRIVTQAPPLGRTIAGDPDRLQQVCWNLLFNAVKFTPRGGTIFVSLQQVGADVTFAVRDTGVGIAPEFLAHLFERFRQADSRFAREHGGLGLGLAIARHLVEAHGGRITAASDGLGCGSTFTVTLPLSREEEGHGRAEAGAHAR